MAKNLSGQRFGRLTVLERLNEKDRHGKTYLYRCRCDCGTECVVSTSGLTGGLNKSCGCLQRENRQTDLTRKRFGRLVGIENTGKLDTSVSGHTSYIWRFRCDCGNECEFPARAINSGRRSCGCLQRETKAKQAISMQDNIDRIEGTNVQNIRSKKIYSNNSSGVRGVFFHKGTGMWCAVIGFKRKKYHLGYFHDLDKAAAARKEAEEMIFDDFLKWYDSFIKNRDTSKATDSN